MKNLTFILFVLLAMALFQGCDKEPERMDDFLAEFATVLKQGDSYRFELDNGRVLIPQEFDGFSGKEGDRVVIFWIPLSGDSVKIKRVSPIFTGGILTQFFPAIYINDPLKIISVWVEGDYLNLILEIEYHSTPHSVALFRDPLSEEIDLYLAHSENEDPPGYPQIMYASFLLSSLQETSETSVPFRLFIDTDKGIRQFDLTIFGAG